MQGGPGPNGKDPRIANPILNRLLTCQNMTVAQIGDELQRWAGDYIYNTVADGTGIPNRDEHLVPGRGTQPCATILSRLASDGYTGTVVLEVNTRRATTMEARQADLAESLEFARLHLGQAAPAPTGAAQRSASSGRR